MDGVVLVLNQNYEPLNVCNLPRAFRLVFGEKAEVIEYDHQVIRTPRTEYRAPSVIRLQHLIRRPRPRVKLSRREVFVRDRHTCQYCGRQAHDMTLDHVVPRHRGGGHTWENLVTACKPCNHRKGGKTLDEARLHLLRPPFEPRSDIYSLFTPYLGDDRNEAWRSYLFLGSQLTATIGRPEAIEGTIPAAVRALLESLWSNGHAAYVVGGSLRDVALGRRPADWDLASDARPERVMELFPGAVYENTFGTVAVRRDGEIFEVTTFRTDHDYSDFRRPHRVEFGDTIELDLARRDFTVNAMAWGARPGQEATFLDPYDGLADLGARVLRAVGDPRKRFEEDALRMVRAVRLAATLEFGIEAATLAGIQARAALVAHLSGERIAAELDKLLAAPKPSVGLLLLSETGLLAHISPDLAAQRGIPQNKIDGEDLWDHTLRAVDAAPPDRPVVRLAALLHDIGKPATFADGHFVRHDAVGADLAAAFLDRLHEPHAIRDRVVELVRHHMFSYEPNWSGAAVRRFIAKMNAIGPGALDELLELREADNVGSGLPAGAGRLAELRARVAAELAAGVALDRRRLAVDGADLITELGLSEGPRLGRILDALLEAVIVDPSLNQRPALLNLARDMLADER